MLGSVISSCWASFQRRRRTHEEVIADNDVEALKRRLDAGLSANDKRSGVPLLAFAVMGLKSNLGYGYPVNFDEQAHIICLLLSRGACPNPYGDGMHMLLSPPAYHEGLVNLTIAYGADFTTYFDEDDVVRQVKAECREGRGLIARYRAEARIFEERGQYQAAAAKYADAKQLAVKCHQEACKKIPPEPGFIIDAYQALIDQITAESKKLPVAQAANGFMQH